MTVPVSQQPFVPIVRPMRVQRQMLPAWPVVAMIAGFPLWWVLGLVVIAPVVLATIMVGLMVIRRDIAIVPGIPAFCVFVLWVVPCAVMIDAFPRLLGYTYRFSVLVVVAITLVYVVNAGRSLPRRTLVNALLVVWVTTIVGGYLAVLFPEVRLSTPVGLLLPETIASNEYVRDLYFPPFAEIQTPWGAPEPFVRPAAPFPYANSWGVAMLLLSPVAIAGFSLARTWLLRSAIILAAAAMIVPAMATSNRGMFAAMGLAVMYIVVRQAARDRAGMPVTVGLFGIAAVVTAIAYDLPGRIAERQLYSRTTESRFQLYAETFQRTLESPILGFGAPRPADTGSISVGTQGYIWMLMFSFGFVGLALFLWFLVSTVVRTWHAEGDAGVPLHAVLVCALGVIGFYGLDIMQLLTIVVVAGILLRERYAPFT